MGTDSAPAAARQERTGQAGSARTGRRVIVNGLL
jgi:hypothetical protein